jgi:predicted nuclease of restriction endonuclease-like (RecB) superfamily
LSWSHVRLIMRVDSAQARHYYLKESKVVNWSVRRLQRNIQSHYYERLLSTADKNSSEDSDQLNDFIKDPYVLECLRWRLVIPALCSQ